MSSSTCNDSNFKHKALKLRYPKAKRDEKNVDVYHGTKIADPYHWLEDPLSKETKEYITAQNAVTFSFINSCVKRQAIHDRLKQLWNFPKYFCPKKTGDGKYYFFKNDGLQNQSVLYVQDSLNEEPRVFLDPNKFSDDGTVSLSRGEFSQDGIMYAYALSANGSDWETIHFINTKTGKKYPEILKKVKWSSISWTHDNQGIFYSCYLDRDGKMDGTETSVDENHKLCYHKINTSQDDDVIVFDVLEEPLFQIEGIVTDCGRWLIVFMRKEFDYNLVYFTEINTKEKITSKFSLTEIVGKFKYEYKYVGNINTKAIFKTNEDAPNFKLISVDLENLKRNNLIAEDSRNVLAYAKLVHEDKLALCYLEDVKSVLKVYDLNDQKFIWQSPVDVGTIYEFSGDKRFSDIFYSFTNFLTPGIIYKTDLQKNEKTAEVLNKIQITFFDSDLYKVDQIFYSSKDGTKIPMFIVFKKDIKLNSSSPCLLWGYGGFNYNITPKFEVFYAAFLQHFDGVVAIPNIRGGGEYGKKWHDAGRLFDKQNCFDDFQSAAEYLIDNRFTSSKKLIINGISNGGLLVLTCANQRPNFFGAVVAEVSVTDMLKLHKFTAGNACKSEYGCSDDLKHFENLLKYSPLHNVRPPADGGQYPAMLLLTSEHDDRVVPLHSLKMIATLQHELGNLPQQKNPFLLRVDMNTGHYLGKPTSKLIEERVDILSFILHTLQLEFKET